VQFLKVRVILKHVTVVTALEGITALEKITEGIIACACEGVTATRELLLHLLLCGLQTILK